METCEDILNSSNKIPNARDILPFTEFRKTAYLWKALPAPKAERGLVSSPPLLEVSYK